MISAIPFDNLSYIDSKTSLETIIRVPHVRQSAWMDNSGNIGVFAINAKTSAKILDVQVPEGMNQATLYQGPVKQSEQTVSPGQTIKWSVAPGRLCSIIFRKIPLNTEEEKLSVLLNIYPNPATDQLYFSIEKSNEINSIRIYTTAGKIIKTIKNTSANSEISISSLPVGIYLIEFEYNNNVFLRKIISKI